MSHKRGPHRILDYPEVNVLLRAGHTQAQVAERFGVTQAAVSAARRRGMVKEGVGKVRSGIPWQLRPEHHNLHAAKMLRCAARLAAGEHVGESNLRQTRRFLEGLESADAVIHYDPDVAPFFFRVPRRAGIDTGLVRDPGRDDRGRRIRVRV